MLPNIVDANFNFDGFFAENYLATNDCILLDKQIGDLTIDLDKITKMKDKGNIGHRVMINKVKAKILLLLKTRENQSALKDCRNQIESTRQEETANIFSTTTSQAETRIISGSKQKQYVLLGVGGLVLLGVLFIIIKKNK